MSGNLLRFSLAVVLSAVSSQAVEVTFDFAPVGNPNVDDDTGYGGVDYAYRISKTEVTNAQYAEFLNAVDPTGVNSLSLYNPRMSSNARGGVLSLRADSCLDFCCGGR